MEIDFTDLGTAKSPNGASVDIPIHGDAFPGAFVFVDIAFFARVPTSIKVSATGTNLKSMGVWSREPDIVIQRFGAVVPGGVSSDNPIHVTVDTAVDPFVCVAYSLNANFQRNVATFVEPAKTSSGVTNPVKFNPIWISPSGTDTVITTLALSHYSVGGVWDGMTGIINIADQLYAGHSEQGGNYPIEMQHTAPKDGNAVWLMVVSAFAVHQGALVDPVRVRGQDNAWRSVTTPAGPAKIRGRDGQWHDLGATDVRVRGAQEWYSLNASN